MLKTCKILLIVLLVIYSPAELSRVIVRDGWVWYYALELPFLWLALGLAVYLLTRWVDKFTV